MEKLPLSGSQVPNIHGKTNGVDSKPMVLSDLGEGLEIYLRDLEC